MIELTDDQVVRMRSDYAAGISQRRIADLYGVNKSVVRRYVEDIPSRPARQWIHVCDGCHTLYYAAARRMYCTADCRSACERRNSRYLLAEFLWIADTDTWENIAARLNFASRDSLERWLYRMGEADWANRVHAAGQTTPARQAARQAA